MPTELLPEWDYDEDNPAFDELIRKGWDAYLKDEYALAGELFETVLREAEQVEATTYIANATLGTGYVLVYQEKRQNASMARSILERALVLARNLDWESGEYYALLVLAALDINERQWRPALKRISQAKCKARDAHEVLQVRELLALLARSVRHYRSAQRLYARCAKDYENQSKWSQAADCWLNAAYIANKRKDFQNAAPYIDGIFRCSEMLGDESIAVSAVTTQATIAIRSGRRREAETLLLNMQEFGKENETRRMARIMLPFSASNPRTYWKYVKAFWQSDD